MSLLGNINTFKTGTYTVTRTAAGTRALGVYTPGSTSTFTADGDLQPFASVKGGEQTMVLPEGFKTENVRRFYTRTELFTMSVSGTADTVAIDGETWIVHAVESWIVPWESQNYYKVTLTRQVVP